MHVRIMFINIKPVVIKALPVRPINLDNKIDDKKPNNGKKIISSVISELKLKKKGNSEEEGFEPTKRNSR